MRAHTTARITLGLGLAGSLALTGCGLTGGDSSEEKDKAVDVAEQEQGGDEQGTKDAEKSADGAEKKDEKSGDEDEKSEEKPEDVVKKAFEAWDEQTETAGTFRVTASEDQMKDLVDLGGEELTESEREEAEKVLEEVRSTELKLRARSTNDEPLKDVTNIEDLDVAFDYVRDGDELVQVMETGDMEIYFRADVKTLLDEFGGSEVPSEKEIQEQIDALPKELSWVEDIYEAEWVGFDPEMVRASLDDSEAGEIQQDVDPETAEKVEKALFEHSEFEQDGDEYTMKIKVKEFIEEEDELVDGMLEDAREADEDSSLPEDADELAEHFTDETFDVVYTIEDEKIRRVAFDPMQAVDLIEEPKGAEKDEKEAFEKAKDLELPMEVEYDEEVGDFEAPEDAHQITEEDLSMLFGGGTEADA